VETAKTIETTNRQKLTEHWYYYNYLTTEQEFTYEKMISEALYENESLDNFNERTKKLIIDGD